jgi:hypothetical protein
MGSVGDSWMTLGFGRAVRDVDPENNDWSRCRYRRTVPSPMPIARCDNSAESATVEIYGMALEKLNLEGMG